MKRPHPSRLKHFFQGLFIILYFLTIVVVLGHDVHWIFLPLGLTGLIFLAPFLEKYFPLLVEVNEVEEDDPPCD